MEVPKRLITFWLRSDYILITVWIQTSELKRSELKSDVLFSIQTLAYLIGPLPHHSHRLRSEFKRLNSNVWIELRCYILNSDVKDWIQIWIQMFWFKTSDFKSEFRCFDQNVWIQIWIQTFWFQTSDYLLISFWLGSEFKRLNWKGLNWNQTFYSQFRR